MSRIIEFNNTNKLLKSGFKGIKTGITKSAGACLSAIWENDKSCINIIVLNSETIEDRFIDTEKLLDYYL